MNTITIFPFLQPFPFDVLCEIISQLESSDRLTFSLVDRSCNRVTNKYIWQTVNIGTQVRRSDHPIRGLAAASDIILKDTSRAYHIYELNIHRLENLISFSPDRRDDAANLEASIKKLTQVLHSTPNLRRLTFTGWSFGRSFACALASELSRNTFSFQLEHFSTNISIGDGLERFLTKQPIIQSWNQQFDYQTVMQPPYLPSSTILPNLESVSDGRVSAILQLVDGRNLQYVSTSTGSDQDVNRLIDGLVSSTSSTSLKTLHFRTDEMGVIATLLRRLPLGLPNLEILHLHFQNASITTSDWDPFIFESMVEFKRLCEFRWSGDSIPEVLLNPGNYGNTTLRRVELVLESGRYWSHEVVEVLTRTGDRSRWKLQ